MNCCEIGSRPEEGAMIILARTNHPITSGRYRDVIGTMTCDTCCEYFRILVIR